MNIVTGDLLDITSGTILHQVNCRGAVGGLAGALFRKWPAAFDDYFEACRHNEAMELGSFILGHARAGLHVCHVFGQVEPGPNTDILAVRRALTEAARLLTGQQVYAPYLMGCGLGGGNWPEYLGALEAAFPDITIIQRPEDAGHAGD